MPEIFLRSTLTVSAMPLASQSISVAPLMLLKSSTKTAFRFSRSRSSTRSVSSLLVGLRIRCAASSRTVANSPAVAGRSAGSFDNILATASTTVSGITWRGLVTAGGVLIMCWVIIATVDSAQNGGAPENISKQTQPSE
jgi:hypothetical protein